VKRITDPSFVWIPSSSHDADSTAFRERQRARMKAAEAARKAEQQSTVRQLNRRGQK